MLNKSKMLKTPNQCRRRTVARRLLGLTVGGSMLLTVGPGQVFALPQGGNVVAGSSTIGQASEGTLNIDQTSARSVIEWQSFGIANGELVNFNLPSSTSVSVNRVVGGELSGIFGSLTSNGNVVLINPNGILFGANARVDLSGLVATTSDITNGNFMAGNLNFDIASPTSASVINQGHITIAEGGLAVFVAPGVANSGVITARLGRVSLASGNRFSVDMFGDGLVNLTLSDEMSGDILDHNGTPLSAYVENSGGIFAEGGRVALSVKAARSVVDNVINMSGVIEARTAYQRNGEIILDGGDSGIVNVTGTLDVSAPIANTKGGKVQVLGHNIGLFDNAVVNASGHAGGGEILVGGDYQGKNAEVRNANAVYISPEASLNADATSVGNGGRIIVWSDASSRVLGTISARGGDISGDGGFVETSSKGYLDVTNPVDVGASDGAGGSWLLDPSNIEITNADSNTANVAGTFQSNNAGVSTINVATLVAALNAGGGVSITVSTSAGTDSGETGDITVSSAITTSLAAGAATLNLTADGTIFVNAAISDTTLDATNKLNVTLNAANGILVASSIQIDGDLALDGNSDNAGAATNAAAAPVSGTADQNNIFVNTGLTLSSSNGTLTLDSTTGGIRTRALTLFSSGTLTINDFLTRQVANFNAVSITSDNRVAINANITVGRVFTIDGDANNSADTNDDVQIAAGVTISSDQGASTIGATTGGITAAGAVTIESGDNLTISDNLTANGAVILDADVDNGGTGTFTLLAGATINSTNNNITIRTEQYTVAGNINAGTGDVSLLPNANVSIGLGSGAGTFQVSQTELNNITSTGTFIIGNTSFASAITFGQADFGTKNVTVQTGAGTINDSDDANTHITTSGALTITSNAVVGGANAQGLNIDVGSVSVTSTGGNDITLRDAGTSNTAYAVATGGAGNISITQSNNDATFSATGDLTTTGNITVAASSGAITMSDGAVFDASPSGDITLTSTGNTTLGQLTSTDGDISVDVTAGDIIDGGDTGGDDVSTTGTLTLTASGTVGGAGGGGGDAAIEGFNDGVTATTSSTVNDEATQRTVQAPDSIGNTQTASYDEFSVTAQPATPSQIVNQSFPYFGSLLHAFDQDFTVVTPDQGQEAAYENTGIVSNVFVVEDSQ